MTDLISCHSYTDYAGCVLRPHPLLLHCSWCESSNACIDASTASSSSSCPQHPHPTIETTRPPPPPSSSSSSSTSSSSSSTTTTTGGVESSQSHHKSVFVNRLFTDLSDSNGNRSRINSGISSTSSSEQSTAQTQVHIDSEKSHLLSNRNYAKQVSLDNYFDDEFYSFQQWVFEMINVGPVWAQGIFGDGIRVRVNDDGVDVDHAEFDGRYEQDSSCDNEEEFMAGSDKEHGTSTASIIGAAADNGLCAAGVAPRTLISSCYALQQDETFLQAKLDRFDISNNSYERPVCQSFERRARDLLMEEKEEAEYRRRSSDNDIGDNNKLRVRRRGRRFEETGSCPFTLKPVDKTYDPCVQCDFDGDETKGGHGRNPRPECVTAIVGYCGTYYEDEVDGCSNFLDLIIGGQCSYVALSSTANTSIVRGVQQGRNGLGVIYVFASGNSNQKGDVTTTKGYTNSRLVMSVAAVGKDGSHAFYSTPGSSVFVSAPGADTEDETKHVTAKPGGGCTDAGMGTSFSAPVVSGVVALMLESNPNLGWRDVQRIIASTSRQVDDIDDPTAQVNGAGFWHSNYYGFGLIDAAQAVETAKVWQNAGPEKLITVDSGIIDLPIADDPATPTTSTIRLDSATATWTRMLQASEFVVESVELLLDISHFSRGDLRVMLTSPSGTKSILHPGGLPENSQLSSNTFWKLLTVRNWGESPFGEWTLTLTDTMQGSLEECVDDGEFFFLYGPTAVYCAYVDRQQICINGGYNEEFFSSGNYEPLKERKDSNGKTMLESCCSCGGGFKREELSDSLRHWTLAIYGSTEGGATRQKVDVGSNTSLQDFNGDSLSIAPSFMPSTRQSPTTETPSQFPSLNPTPPTTGSPSSSTSIFQSDLPSLSPSSGSLSPSSSLSPTGSLSPSIASSTATPTSAPSDIEAPNPTDPPVDDLNGVDEMNRSELSNQDMLNSSDVDTENVKKVPMPGPPRTSDASSASVASTNIYRMTIGFSLEALAIQLILYDIAPTII